MIADPRIRHDSVCGCYDCSKWYRLGIELVGDVDLKSLGSVGESATCRIWKVGDKFIRTLAVEMNGMQTRVCECDSEGEEISGTLLDGSFQGGINHGKAFADYVDSLP